MNMSRQGPLAPSMSCRHWSFCNPEKADGKVRRGNRTGTRKERGERCTPSRTRAAFISSRYPLKNHGAPLPDKPDDWMLPAAKGTREARARERFPPGVTEACIFRSQDGPRAVSCHYGKRGDTEPPEQKQRSRDKEIFQREFHGNGLFRAEKPVSCIAETGNDITVVVQMTVKGCSENVHIRVISVDF